MYNSGYEVCNFMRMLRYMAPSKGNIILVVIVSVLTSLFSIVSLYSILPLLHTVFSTIPAAQQSTAQQGQGSNRNGLQSIATKSSTPQQQPLQLSNTTTSAEKLKNWALIEISAIVRSTHKKVELFVFAFSLYAPYLFTHEDHLYTIPECCGSSRIQLYQANHFFDEWQHQTETGEWLALVDRFSIKHLS